MKYRDGGKEKRLAFGAYPAVGLKDARVLATAARNVLATGADPGDFRKAEKAKAVHEAVNTFEAVAGEWLAHPSSRWTPLMVDDN